MGMPKIYRKLVKDANRMLDPLKELDLTPEKSPDEDVEFSCFKRKVLPADIRIWAADLLERNMKTFYEQSNWGWNRKAKEEELDEKTAYYLVVKKGGQLVGYSHFRFDLDYDVPVVYCYEIQFEQQARGLGFGTAVVNLLGELGKRAKMKKVVATIFKHNEMSRRFFDKAGFVLDDSSPVKGEKADYVIVSKAIARHSS